VHGHNRLCFFWSAAIHRRFLLLGCFENPKKAAKNRRTPKPDKGKESGDESPHSKSR
jgi:hypothetical protein